MKKILFALPVAVLAASVFTGTAKAAPIALTKINPDIFVDGGVAKLTVSGSTRELTLTGVTEQLSTDALGTHNLTTVGSFTAIVDLALVGSTTGANEQFTITGGSLLVTGNGVTQWSAGVPVGFGFTNTTGANVAADFEILYLGGTGAQSNGKGVDVWYHASTAIANYGTNFLDVPFTTNQIVPIGTADVFAPEPTSIALLGLAAPVLIRRRRRA